MKGWNFLSLVCSDGFKIVYLQFFKKVKVSLYLKLVTFFPFLMEMGSRGSFQLSSFNFQDGSNSAN